MSATTSSTPTRGTAQNADEASKSWSGILVARIMNEKTYQTLRRKPPAIATPFADPALLTPPLRGNHLSVIADQKQSTEKGEIVSNSSCFSLPKLDEEDQDDHVVSLDLYLCCGEEQEHRHHIHMKRECAEDISRTLQRMEISVSKKLSTQKQAVKTNKATQRKHKSRSKSPPNVAASPERVPQGGTKPKEETNSFRFFVSRKEWRVAGMTTAAVWKHCFAVGDGAVELQLSMGGTPDTTIPLQIYSCPPSVLSFKTFGTLEGARIFAPDSDETVAPAVSVLTDPLYEGDWNDCFWFVVDNDGTAEMACHGPTFTPESHHVGKRLRVVVQPRRADAEKEISKLPWRNWEVFDYANYIEVMPPLKIPEIRRGWFNTHRHHSRASDTFRIVTYNILADQNAVRDEPYSHYMYPWCTPEHLSKAYRMPLVLSEILSCRADIICLQEVDDFVYWDLLLPALQSANYQGFFSSKAISGLREGCALFWSLDKFEQLSRDATKTFAIRDLFLPLEETLPTNDNDDWAVPMQRIQELMRQNEATRDVLLHRLGHVVQMATLTTKWNGSGGQQSLVVANTHLFFHPRAAHIRVLQAFVLCRQMERERQKSHVEPLPPALLCGDLNATPDSGAYELLSQRRVDSGSRAAWEYLNTYRWVESEDEESGDHDEEASTTVAPPPIPTIPPVLYFPDSFPVLQSAYDEELPDFTHHLQRFVATLDHILGTKESTNSNGLEKLSTAPMPCREDVEKEYVAMPNEVMPSDHVSLICDYQFTKSLCHNRN